MRNLSFQQIIETIAKPYTDVLGLLREQELLPAAEVEGKQFVVYEPVVGKLQEPILRIDPATAHQVVGESTVASLLAAVSSRVDTFSTQPYILFPSSSPDLPYLMLYFMGLARGTQHTVAIDMQVHSAGGIVRITATNNPLAILVTHSGSGGDPLPVQIMFTTSADGDGAVALERVDQTSFSWFGASLF